MQKINTLSELENTVAVSGRRERTEAAILGTIALVGFIGAIAMAPNAVSVLQHMVPDTRPISHKQSVRRTIGRLIKNGNIRKTDNKYKLTKKGKKRLNEILTLSTASLNKRAPRKKWDGKWRVVTFDIKESRRHVRDELRSLLIQSGFVKLHDSIWVYPYRCDEIITLLKFKLTLGFDLIYIIADAIEGDEWLRKHYKLKEK